jgi:hypothetical protein
LLIVLGGYLVLSRSGLLSVKRNQEPPDQAIPPTS